MWLDQGHTEVKSVTDSILEFSFLTLRSQYGLYKVKKKKERKGKEKQLGSKPNSARY